MKEEYMSEEELKQLIEEVEQSAMLRAPAYLKEQILKEIQNAELKQTPSVRQSITEYRKNIRKQLLVYELKVAGLVAAAILMLFLLPIWRPENSKEQVPIVTEENYDQDSGFLYHWNTASGKMMQCINITSNVLLHPDEFLSQFQNSEDRDHSTKGE